MYHSCHIHIKGLVQGVGFRPFVCRLAKELHISGWVSNTNDGVHIECTADDNDIAVFYQRMIYAPPANAIIVSHHITTIPSNYNNGFVIKDSSSADEPDLLLTPDISICDCCKNEIKHPQNKRFQYAFTTCLNCGPRYSIVEVLPYDRANTTMSVIQMCSTCKKEYNNIQDRRHFSQTNSCPDCAIHLHLFKSKDEEYKISESEMCDEVVAQIKQGKIVAVKGMGGYLLLCDATNEKAVHTLRLRKQRPAKPFALLYSCITSIDADVQLHQFEIDALLRQLFYAEKKRRQLIIFVLMQLLQVWIRLA